MLIEWIANENKIFLLSNYLQWRNLCEIVTSSGNLDEDGIFFSIIQIHSLKFLIWWTLSNRLEQNWPFKQITMWKNTHRNGLEHCVVRQLFVYYSLKDDWSSSLCCNKTDVFPNQAIQSDCISIVLQCKYYNIILW